MNEWLSGLIGLLLGVGLGGSVVGLVLLLRRSRSATDQANARARAELLETENRRQFEAMERQRIAFDEIDQRREVAEREVSSLTERVRSREEQLREHEELLGKAKTELSDAFTALGTRALRANNEQFLELAKTTFDGLLTEAKSDVEKRRVAIDSLVKPIHELLEKQNTAVGEIEKKREVAFRGLEEQIKGIATAHDKLNTETGRLVTALRRPEQRGQWGEMQLRNVVELAGMTAHCDFVEQVTTDGDEGRQRPDMIVKMPGNGVIVVDAKVALDAYLDSIQPDSDRTVALKRHARQVSDHVRNLASKQYWNQFERTPKIVVMFMPLETALTSALEVDPDLHANAMRNNVLIATPTLLVALLRAVAYGWQQEDVAANAREISTVGRDLYNRLATFVRSFEKVGSGLERASRAYNSAVGSLEARLLPSARDLKRLHASTEKDVEQPGPVEVEVRKITLAELKPVPEVPGDALPDSRTPAPLEASTTTPEVSTRTPGASTTTPRPGRPDSAL